MLCQVLGSVVYTGPYALQGSFREHVLMLNKLPGVEGREVRTREQLLSVDSLIIPGGEAQMPWLLNRF